MTELAEHVRRPRAMFHVKPSRAIVDQAPPLTDEVREQISALLAPAPTAEERHTA